MEETPDVSARAVSARMSMSGCRTPVEAGVLQRPSESIVLYRDRARHQRFAELGKLAAVFAHEVGNPGAGSASLQFALKDLARFTLLHSAKKGCRYSDHTGAIQGALREGDRLVELLNDFRSNGPCLICEISEVMEKSRNVAERDMDRVLKSKMTLSETNAACG